LSTMDLFHHYEEDFIEARTQAETRIKNIPSCDPARKVGEVQACENDIQDAAETLRNMMLSARSLGENPATTTKLKAFEAELNKLRVDLRKSEMAFHKNSDRDTLFSGGLKDDILAGSLDQREHLLSTTDRLSRTNTQLKQAMATAQDTENVGIEIMENLDRQRVQMVHIKENLSGINEKLAKANRIMRVIGRRIYTNKAIMFVIILVLVVTIFLIAYLKWFSGGSSSKPAPVVTTTTGTTGIIAHSTHRM